MVKRVLKIYAESAKLSARDVRMSDPPCLAGSYMYISVCLCLFSLDNLIGRTVDLHVHTWYYTNRFVEVLLREW